MPRDFGSFEIDYQKFIFKHAYYDKSMQYGSEDPGDPKKTTRVLTIMIAAEYLGRRLPLEIWSSICQSLNSEPHSSAPLCASPTRRARITLNISRPGLPF